LNEHLHTDPGGLSGIHEDLLVKHLLGETGPEESARVESWLAADPANRHYYEHFRLIWQESRRLGDNSRGSDEQEEAAWQKFRQRIHRPSPERTSGSLSITELAKVTPEKERVEAAPPKGQTLDVWRNWTKFSKRPIVPNLQAVKATPPTVPRRRILPSWARVAAILLLVASITGLVYLAGHNTAAPDKIVASNTAVLTDTLPDGSLITLNKQSDISYPAKFKSQRTVKLQGEAFFKIASEKEKPFRVYTNGITITVLGTSFNVRNKGTTTEIIVESGLVRVTDSLHSILLHPSEKLILHKGDTTLSRDATRSELYKYYRTKEFICDNTPLWQLAESLEEAYDVKIEIASPLLRQQKINTVFRNASLDQILSVIQETFRIKVIRSGDKVTLQQ